MLACRRVEALEHARPALDGYRRVAAADPASIPKMRVVCIATIWAARLARAGVGEDAFPRAEVGRQLDLCAAASEKMVAADPDNRRALFDLAYFDVESGDWQQGEGDQKGAAATWSRGVAILNKLSDTTTAGASANEQIFVHLYRRLADSATDSEKYAEALEDLTQAEAYTAAIEKQQPDSLICLQFRAEIARARADVFKAQKLWPNAIGEVRTSIAADDAIALRDPENQKPLSEAAADYILLARCLVESGRRQDSLSAVNTAMDRYAAITSRRALDPVEERRRAEAQTLLARSQFGRSVYLFLAANFGQQNVDSRNQPGSRLGNIGNQ
jgi:tetratricopeptide (TPR) repeat protein